MKARRVALVGLLCVGLATVGYHVVLPTDRRLEHRDSTLVDDDLVKVSQVGRIDRLRVLTARDERLYAVDDHVFYVSEDGGRHFRELGRLPKVGVGLTGRLRDWVARTKLVRAIRRNNSVGNLALLRSGTMLVFYDRIYRSADGGRTFEVVFEGDEKPFGDVAVTEGDTVYFGDYTTAARPHEVRILRGSDDGRRWEVAHTFPSGDVFHVHGIQYDSVRRWLYVATGDRDAESRLYYTGDHFQTLNLIGGGSQEWRIVSLISTPEALYWGNDDDVEGSAIFRYDFADRRLERLQDIGKPSYYSARLNDGSYMVSTTYEPASPFTQRHRPSPTTDLWISRDGRRWRKVLELEGREVMMEWGPARPTMRVIASPGPRPLAFVNPAYTTSHDYAATLLMIDWK